MADDSVMKKINAPNSRLSQLLNKRAADEIVEELFLATLSRFPTEEEKKLAQEHRPSRPDRNAVYADILWALINTREFILNH